MNKPATLLYIEDDDLDRRAFLRLVREKGLPWQVTVAESLAAARAQLAASRFDVIVADYHLPDGHSTELFDEVPDIPFVLLTGTLEEQLALRTLERGADDYLPKDAQQRHLEALPFAVEKTLYRKRIHERERQLTQELAENRERFASIVDSAMDAIITIDDQERIVQFNPAAEKMLGCSAQQALGSSIDRFVPTAARDAHREHIRLFEQPRLAEWPKGHPNPASALRADGTEFPVEVAIARVEVGDKKLFSITLHDITERRRAEEALRQAKEAAERSWAQQEAVFRSMTEGLVVFDAQGHLLDMNPAALTIHGFDSVQTVQRHLKELDQVFEVRDLEGNVLPLEQWPIARALRGETFKRYEVRVRRTDGSRQWIGSYGGAPVRDAEGRMILAIVTLRDVTYAKETEQRLRESQQELQDANWTLERRVRERTAEVEARSEQLRQLAAELTRTEQRERRRLATILHDHLQQLLVGTRFSTGMLRGRMADGEGLEHLQKVDGLLDQALAASRDLTVELAPPILSEGGLAPALRWLANWMHEKHGLQVQVEADEAANPADEEIRTLLFQSVRELLFNVVKHAQVHTATVTVDRCCKDRMRVIVADQGAGFDPDSARRRTDTSTGLGLSSMQERLEAMGSQLEMDSAPGKGARMTLVVPLHLHKPPETTVPAVEEPAATQAAAAERKPPAQSGCIRVLIADDHTVVRDGMTRLLQMQGDIEVVGTAADGQQAIELSSLLQPDVVLMDVSMPRLNGIEATRQLRRLMRQICIIGLSMHGEEETALRMREAGAAHYLTKTTPPQHLIATIRACVRA